MLTQQQIRQLLKENAPYVYQTVNLHTPVVETPKTPPEDDFIKGLEEDQKKLEQSSSANDYKSAEGGIVSSATMERQEQPEIPEKDIQGKLLPF